MGKMRKTSVEDWKEMAREINEVREKLLNLRSEYLYKCPKTVYGYNWRAARRNFDKVKSKLEDRFAKEHPEEFDIRIFYPGDK